jgi:L-threonylcarbamoyladenylate synthase
MITEYYKISTDLSENNRIFDRGGKIIRAGGLVAFPTETVYGLGANALDADAAEKIYKAKGRPSDNPLIIHIAHIEDANKYCVVNDIYMTLAKKFMPGPLTVVLPKRNCIPHTVTGGLDTVAVRLPSDKNARSLIDAAGVPIAAPSANLSGRPSPTTAEHVLNDMNGRIDMIIDGGECDVGLESTIVKVEKDHLILLRPGAVTLEMLETVSPVLIDKSVIGKLEDGEQPLAPGMKYRHYAPDTKVVLIDSSNDEKFIDFIIEKSKITRVGALVSDRDAERLRDSGAVVLNLGSDYLTEAHNLFARLREIDTMKCDVFYARLPDKAGIGLAVYNRIIKAAGYEVLHI